MELNEKCGNRKNVLKGKKTKQNKSGLFQIAD